jgi:predicted HTH transcriptional regulator
MLTDEELALRIISTEDNYVERKTAGDNKRWIPALVAFANSAPVGFDCVLFIGVKDNGTLEPDVGVESLQKSFSEKAAEVFPPVPYASKVFRRQDRECLAVIVPGSPDRPHYAGQPYVRIGSESKKADAEQFARMTAEHDPKAREILKRKGQVVTVELLNAPEAASRIGRSFGSSFSRIQDCNQFWVTLDDGRANVQSITLRRIELSFDHNKNQLKLEVSPS